MDFAERVHPAPRQPRTPQSPLPPALQWTAAALVALGLGALVGLTADALLAPSVSLALFGAYLSFRRWQEGLRLRAAADKRIRAGAADASCAWRVDELISARERKLLARSLRSLVDELRSSRLPGATPLNRAGLRPNESLLSALADRLAAFDVPVRPEGILEVHRLLTSAGSPLYSSSFPDGEQRPADAVASALAAALSSLEVR